MKTAKPSPLTLRAKIEAAGGQVLAQACNIRSEEQVNSEAVPYSRLQVYPGLASLSGLPATAFPWGRTRDGLPIGLQAIGPYLEDRTPITFAALLEHVFGGFVPPPGYQA